MKRPDRPLLGLAAGLLLGPAAVTAAQSDAPAPNIIFFLADDMGLGDTSAYQDLTGNSDANQVDTPHLERLANRGTRFTDAHSNAAVCTPTRLAFLTGTHAFRSPIRQRTSIANQNVTGTLLQGDRKTVAHMLSDSGYGTYGIGKWHIALQVDFDTKVVHEGPIQSGFDKWTGTPANFPGSQGLMRDNELLTYDSDFNVVPFDHPDAIDYDAATADNPDAALPRAITEQIQKTNLAAAQTYLADHVANRADDPFFMYYASHSNHTPYIAGAELDGTTVDGHTKAGGYLNVPTTTDADGNVIPTGPDYGNVGLDNHWEPYLQTDADGNVTRSGPGERAKLVDENDVAMGKLLDYLESTDDPRNPGHKLIDNTLVVFTSDNGSDINAEPAVGALPQSSNGATTDIKGKKANFEEGGTRVPFIAAWGDRIQNGETSDALFGTNDMYATFAGVAGHELESTEAVDSENVLTALTGDADGDFRDSSLIYKQRDHLIIRRGELKLIAVDPDADRSGTRFDGNIDYADLEVKRVFDLANDLGETSDLKNSNDAALQAEVTSMLAELQGYVDAGFSRTGAAAISNGTNFQGGDLLTANNYVGYGDVGDDGISDGTLKLPRLTRDAPSFVYVNGTATDRVDNAWIIQGNGTVAMSTKAGLQNNARYELRDGTLTADTSFQVNDGSELLITGGTLDADGQVLRMVTGDGTITLADGEITARLITVEQLQSASAGSKVVRFTDDGPGATLIFTASDPIKFGDTAAADDYIDFLTGSLGSIVAPVDAAYYEALFDDGRLRVDGVAEASLAGAFGDYFAVTDLGGARSLSLVPEPTTALLLSPVLAPALRRRRRAG